MQSSSLLYVKWCHKITGNNYSSSAKTEEKCPISPSKKKNVWLLATAMVVMNVD